MDFERNVHCLMGLPIDAVDMGEAVQRVREAAFNNKRCLISTPNLNFVVAARSDAAFRDAVVGSDLCLADGMPLVWVARLLGIPIPERVSGAGLFERLLKHPGPPVTVYFFGGPEGVAEAACKRINELDGGLRCVGFDAPGFGSVEEISSSEHIDRINLSGAMFVIVSLGAKKGQHWLERNRARLHAPVLCHLGAVVNFAAGTIRRAPQWIQTSGAEWLWRIKEEPGLWRRYWADGWAFIDALVRHILPSAFRRLRLGGRPAQGKSSMIVSTVGTRSTIALRGHWDRQQVAPLRFELRSAYEAGSDLVIDLADCRHLDSACIGLLILARGAIGAERFAVLNASATLSENLQAAGADYLREFPAAI